MDASTQHRITVAKDVLLFVGGMVGIAYQTVTGHVNFALLAVFTAMTGVPGLTNMISLIRGSDTKPPSPSSPSPDLPTDSGS